MLTSVLMIDDELVLHKMIESYLQDSSIELHSTLDGQAGLSAAKLLQPDLILLDINLPDMNGLEVCRQLRENPDTSRIPVLFLTADALSKDKIDAMNLGAVEYMIKPFVADELCARIHALVRMQRQITQQCGIDGVTGLWDRTFLDSYLKVQLSLAAQTNRPLSCIVADIDGLRLINKQRGRAFANHVLRSVGRLLLSHCDAEETICSCGGGKFCILKSGADRNSTARRAEKLCEEIRQQPIAGRGYEVSITCSFGVADTRVAEGGLLFERAQAAMVRAKENGPGSVSVARAARRCASLAA